MASGNSILGTDAWLTLKLMPHAFVLGKAGVLFFSRGRGHSHAVRDMAIIDELAKLRDNFDLKFVSYGTGALTLAEHRKSFIDLDMPDISPTWTTVARAGQTIRHMRPSLVISHEEFAALPVAKIFGVPTIFITDWFSDADDFLTQSLSYADEIIFIEEAGMFDEPANVEGRVSYTGPVLRSLHYTKADRSRARRELSFPQDGRIILVAPGSWTESMAPIYDVVMSIFNMLDDPKLLVWIAGTDYELLLRLSSGHKGIVVKERDWQMDRLMVASNLAITKANRGTIRELSALGIPSISISHGHNPIDDLFANRIETNTPLDIRTINLHLLAASLLEALQRETLARSDEAPCLRLTNSNGAALAAQKIAERIGPLLPESGGPD